MHLPEARSEAECLGHRQPETFSFLVTLYVPNNWVKHLFGKLCGWFSTGYTPYSATFKKFQLSAEGKLLIAKNIIFEAFWYYGLELGETLKQCVCPYFKRKATNKQKNPPHF